MRPLRPALFLAAALLANAALATAPDTKPDAPKKPEAEAVSPADKEFSDKWSAAMKALGTSEGATYDEAVGRYLSTQPDYKATIHKCMADNPGKHTVTGYLEYDATGYKIKFRPENGFSTCIKRYLEGREIPKPPRVPFLIPMSFTSE
jgi:hypothetical protein